MIHIAIVEDRPSDQERMKEYLENYFQDRERPKIRMFNDGEAFLKSYPPDLDLVLMDIEMKGMDGIQTARSMRKLDTRVQLLFVTNLIKFALEGYAVDAADFIVKPVRYPAFCASMDRVMRRMQARGNRFLTVRQGRETVCCSIREITYIESLNKKTILHRRGTKEIKCTDALYALEKKLEQEAFFRCHNAFLVNLDYIRSMTASEVTVDGVSIPVSKYRKKEFMQALVNYRGRML